MMTTSYRLDNEPPTRSVFVTQLHEREDEENRQGYNEYPVVKETGGKLLDTGINTLQRTLLLKKEVEIDKVNQELFEKREDFRQRMETCAERQTHIQRQQQEMKDRVAKFEKFIQENEAKRRRAIQKYQAEVKAKVQKSSELDQLLQQLAEVKSRHEYLKDKLDRYKKYEEYMLKVIDVLPAHYLAVQDSMLNSLMMRHFTLSSTNNSLVDNLNSTADELEVRKAELEEIKAEHDKQKLSINSQLSRMQTEQEQLSQRNQQTEAKGIMGRVSIRAQRAEFGQITMAIDNIAEKCKRRIDPVMDGQKMFEEEMSLERKMSILHTKLNIVKAFVCDKSDVHMLASREGSVSPGSEVKSMRVPAPAKKKAVALSSKG